MDAWVWILLVVVVVAVVAAVLASRSRQRENRRVEAAELRDPTADHHMELREKEAAAAASEAEARRVRAEADQRAAEAQRLEVQAQRAGKDRDVAASTSEEQLRRADELDPDVRTDKEGHRVDDEGNRIATGTAAGAGVAAAGAAATSGHDAGRTDDEAAGAAVDRDAKVGSWDRWEGRESDRAPGEHGLGHGRHDDDGRIGNMKDLDRDDLDRDDLDRDDLDRDDVGDGEAPAGAAGGAGTGPEDPVRAGDPATGETSDLTPVGTEDDGDGRADEAYDEHRPVAHRIGNMKGLDEDDAVGSAEEPGTAAVGEMDDRDQARRRAADVLARRDADAERQPE